MATESASGAARAAAREPLDPGSFTGGSPVVADTADGVAAAESYGAPDAQDADDQNLGDQHPDTEYRRLVEGCGLVDRLWVEHLELTGEDRGRFLNGMVTGDTRALAPGDGRFVFFTSAQGRVLAEARIMALADRLLLELPAGCAGPIAEHLSRYIVADRVEVAPRPGLRALSLVGPDSWAVATRLAPGAARPAERWSSIEVEWRGETLALSREERLGGPAVTVHVADAAALEVARRLVEDLKGVAAGPVGFAAAETLRVEAGLARFGADYGRDERFPQEVDGGDALDFEKGCYLGQEVVARIHYRGKVNHRLCGLRLAGDQPPGSPPPGSLPPPGSTVELDGGEVGRSGTAVRSPALGAGLALAVLHRKAEPGATVRLAGTEAEVIDLPLAAGGKE